MRWLVRRMAGPMSALAIITGVMTVALGWATGWTLGEYAQVFWAPGAGLLSPATDLSELGLASIIAGLMLRVVISERRW
jgi:hypothetical protein